MIVAQIKRLNLISHQVQIMTSDKYNRKLKVNEEKQQQKQQQKKT